MTRAEHGTTRRVVVVSQLPPPYHGSTMMTQRLMEVLAEASPLRNVIVDKRFSQSITDIGKRNPVKLLGAISLAVRVFRATRTEPSICIYFLTNRPASFLVDAAVITLISRHTPLVLYIHTAGYERLAATSRLWRGIMRKTFARSTRIVTLGPSLKPDLDGVRNGRPVVTIANTTPDIGRNALHGGKSDAAHTVLFLSNLLPDKGAHTFIEMAMAIAPLHKGTSFHVIGAIADDDYHASLRRQLDSSEYGARIKLHTHASQEDKWNLLAEASLLVFPSTYQYEAQPLSLIEALSTGTPIIGFDVGGVRDIVSGDVGALVQPSTHNLAIATHELLSSPERQSRLSLAARQRYEQYFSIDVFRDAWLTLLKDLMVQLP